MNDEEEQGESVKSTDALLFFLGSGSNSGPGLLANHIRFHKGRPFVTNAVSSCEWKGISRAPLPSFFQVRPVPIHTRNRARIKRNA